MWEAARYWQWATARLQADTAVQAALPGGLHYYLAPPTLPDGVTPLPTPYLVFQRQTPGTDMRSGSGSVRVMHKARYVTKIVGPVSVPGGMAAIVAAVDAVSACLDVQRGATADGLVLMNVRDGDFELPELLPDSKQLWTSILLYWLAWTQPNA